MNNYNPYTYFDSYTYPYSHRYHYQDSTGIVDLGNIETRFIFDLILANFCNDILVKHSNLIFDSSNFTSFPESTPVSLLKRDDLQMKEVEIWYCIIKWGITQDPTLPTKFKEWTKEIKSTILPPILDGFAPQTFRNICHGHSRTIVVAKVKGTGEIIGGYTLTRDSNNINNSQWKKTNDSFIFSLKNGNIQNSILSRCLFRKREEDEQVIEWIDLRNRKGSFATYYIEGWDIKNQQWKRDNGNSLENNREQNSSISFLWNYKRSRNSYDEGHQKRNFSGVLPYIAPEVLVGEEYTKAADVYLQLYSDVPHDNDLALKICKGLRPKIPFRIPKLITQVIMRCWNSQENINEITIQIKKAEELSAAMDTIQLRLTTKHIHKQFILVDFIRISKLLITK
ncbi:hypothetical protein Glove_71g61 [Diversispora epigaea]|uniref:TLDc domain-containing protein n=1 Tax=Diversispora epigaea TaxID=1348612 RepID=A0A397JGS4_9GLOM|nr:hypothetical protein Glove_71g61 [Diversispora epigaea]